MSSYRHIGPMAYLADVKYCGAVVIQASLRQPRTWWYLLSDFELVIPPFV